MESTQLRSWMTVEQAAEEAGFSRTWILRLLHEGRLKGHRFNGRAWMVSKSGLTKYLKERQPIGRPKNTAASRKP